MNVQLRRPDPISLCLGSKVLIRMINLTQKALHLLFHSEAYPGMEKKEASDVKLILLRNDSLGEYTTWSFIRSNGHYTVRRTIWKQRVAYHLSEPETFCREFIIPNDIAIPLVDSFIKLIDGNIDVTIS